MANNKRKKQSRKKAKPRNTQPTNTSPSQPAKSYTNTHITTSTFFEYIINQTFTILIRPTIAMFTNFYQLLGGMTVTVLAILYPVVTRIFTLSDPHETRESGSVQAARKSKRHKSKKNARPPVLPTRTALNTPTSRTPSPPPSALPSRRPAASSSSADPQRESASSGSDTAVEDLPDAIPTDSELTPAQELEATLRSLLPGDVSTSLSPTCLERKQSTDLLPRPDCHAPSPASSPASKPTSASPAEGTA
jgi:hypothetical protein